MILTNKEERQESQKRNTDRKQSEKTSKSRKKKHTEPKNWEETSNTIKAKTADNTDTLRSA